MTVADMRDRVSGDEWMGWLVYHAKKAQTEQLERLRAGG